MKVKDDSIDRKILSYMLKNKKFIVELDSAVKSNYFDDKYSWIFEIVTKHFNNPQFKEIPTTEIAKDYLTKENRYSEEKIALYNELSSAEVNDSEFTWLLEKLKERYTENLQNDILLRAGLLKNDDNRIEKINKVLKDGIIEIDSVFQKKIFSEGALSKSALDRWREYKEIEANPDLAKGAYTGIHELDRRANGLKKQETVLIVGNTGGGKSVLLTNLAVNMWLGNNNPYMDPSKADESGLNVLIFSLEMPKKQYERRCDSCMGELYYSQIRDGKLGKEDKEKYARLLKFQSQYKKEIYIVDMPSNCSVQQMELKLLEVKEKLFIPDVIICDYMGIMVGENPDEQDWLALSRISQSLHELARVHDIILITAAQANRSPKEGKQEYSTNRVSRSDGITHHFNIIMQISNRQEEELKPDMEIYITKFRDSEKGKFNLLKDFSKMKVKNIEDQSYSIMDDDEEDTV